MIYDRVRNELHHNKQERESGRDIVIPWPNLPRLSTVLPGVQKGRYIIVTANSKVGKTQIADYLFLYEPLDYVLSNPGTNLKLKVFYFSLEMSKEDKLLQMISNKIYKDTGKLLSPDDLKSYFGNYTLDNATRDLIDTYRPYFEKIEQVVTFIDNISNPFGIYKEVRDYAAQNGKFYMKDGTEAAPAGMYDHYVANNPDEYVIVITDHVSLLSPEKSKDYKQKDLRETIFEFSTKYCMKMRDNFKYTIVNVQQQSSDQEKQQFVGTKGNTVIEKLKPSADGLGDCKTTSRDCDLLIGLFAPSRYNQKEYKGYDLTELRDHYRELTIILNRRGGGSIGLSLYFEGAVNYFRELGKEEFRSGVPNFS